MRKSLKLSLFIYISIMSVTPAIYADDQVGNLTEEEELLITDRDRGSRERPNLYYYNKQNVRYNRRYEQDNNYQQNGNYYYNQPSEDTFNRSYYQDNTSPNLYLNR